MSVRRIVRRIIEGLGYLVILSFLADFAIETKKYLTERKS